MSIEHQWRGTSYRTFVRPVHSADHGGGAICLTIDAQEIVQEHERALVQAIEVERRRVLTDFLDDATHDLRTPLSVIHTNLYLMEKATDPDKLKARRDMLKASISQLEEMLQNMFLMARLDLLPSFVQSEFDLNAAVSEAIDQIRVSAQDRQIEIAMELSPALPYLMGHSGEMQLAIYHIARNAVQHTQEGAIRVATRHENHQVIIEIADTGEGIPAEDIPNIFKRFYRGDKARTLVGARNGMGLAIAQKVVEKHNGSIQVTSQVGRGTTMTIVLPL
jgi:signal transduction histidine kinase